MPEDMQTTLQVRINKETKEKARNVFSALGLDISSAIKLYFIQVINQKRIPFAVVTANGFTPAKEERLLAETRATLKSAKSYRTARELHEAICG